VNSVTYDILTQRIKQLGNLPAMPSVLATPCEALSQRACKVDFEYVVENISFDNLLPHSVFASPTLPYFVGAARSPQFAKPFSHSGFGESGIWPSPAAFRSCSQIFVALSLKKHFGVTPSAPPCLHNN
jgi:hypothetical protein